MWLNILLILAGLVLLERGATWFVSGSSSLARRMHVSELTIGLTIVAFGTSAPELVVNCFAASSSNHDIVFGNIIGSNIFNLFVILSIMGLIRPLKVQSSTAWKEIPFSIVPIILLFTLANDRILRNFENSKLGIFDAILLLLVFTFFLFYTFKHLKTENTDQQSLTKEAKSYKTALLVLFGLAGLIAGGKLVVDHAVQLALEIGVSDKLIGMLIIAPGTSLPELATSIVATIRKKNDIAVGNIIGSNIFNVLFVLPVSTFIRPLIYNPEFNIELGFLAIGTIILFAAMYTGKRKQIDRWEAFVLFASYLAYIVWMY